MRSHRLCTVYAPPLPGPSQRASPGLQAWPVPSRRASRHVAARSQPAPGVRSPGNSRVRAPPVSSLLQTWLSPLFRYPALPRKHTQTHTDTHTHIYTRSSAPAPRAETMDDSNEEYEAAFRSLLRKLTLSSGGNRRHLREALDPRVDGYPIVPPPLRVRGCQGVGGRSCVFLRFPDQGWRSRPSRLGLEAEARPMCPGKVSGSSGLPLLPHQTSIFSTGKAAWKRTPVFKFCPVACCP